jgi:D-alanyl-D-alanine dipeptidase
MKSKSKIFCVIGFVVTLSLYGCNSKVPIVKTESNITRKTPSPAMISDKTVPLETPVQAPKEKVSEEQIKESPKPPTKIDGLINILDKDTTIVVDLKYATADNFTGKVIYDFTACLLREETAIKLSKANKELSQSGYRIKIYDGYRPPYAQEVLWDKVPNPKYVANPYKGGSIHSKGAAVDITIIDSDGNELEMPTKYDDLSSAASPSSTAMSETARKNMLILQQAMTNNGFKTITSEWWHFNDTDSSKYSIIEVDPKKFEGGQN